MTAHNPSESNETQQNGLPAGRWLWAVAVALTVFIASGRGQVAAPAVVNIDKIAHCLVFGLIATLVRRSFHKRRWVWIAIVITSAYGLADEGRQSLTPGRSVELADWIADTFGAVLAVTLYQCWPWYRRLLEMPLIRRRKPRVEKAGASLPTEGVTQ